jgi:hypothetical protein
MERIIEKVEKIKDNAWADWTLEEKHQLLKIYYSISKKENYIFDLIYGYHGCDSWEDIFRDYDHNNLKDKAVGVKIAIKEIKDQIELKKEK